MPDETEETTQTGADEDKAVAEAAAEAAAEATTEEVDKEESEEQAGDKRKREEETDKAEEDKETTPPEESSDTKKAKTDESSPGGEVAAIIAGQEGPEPEPVPPGTEGVTVFNDHDVLSGRGGGTNVHPGNRNFRDLINLHRRAYLKARKNDKPSISRAIVRSVRENNGRFLKKDEKTGLWLEIGDDAAREKTSQALRQRAPEMRKLLFDTEREEARAAAEEHLRQQRMLMGMPPEMMANMPPGMPMGPGGPMFPNPAMFAQMAGKSGMNMPNGQDFSQMFPAAFMGPPGMNRVPPPNASAPAAESTTNAPAAAETENATV